MEVFNIVYLSQTWHLDHFFSSTLTVQDGEGGGGHLSDTATIEEVNSSLHMLHGLQGIDENLDQVK